MVDFVVSIHAPTWGATLFMDARPVSQTFQSTPPRGGRRPVFCRQGWQAFWRFNPRPHVGGDLCACYQCVLVVIVSIHAPTWGATDYNDRTVMLDPVSIHAPTWGATSGLANRP